MTDERKTTIDVWLDAELDRMWLIAERRLRRMQASGATFGPALAALEPLLAVRRAKRGTTEVTDVLGEVNAALAQRSRTLGALRTRAPIGALAARLGLCALEVDVLVAVFAPLIDPPLTELFQLVRGSSPRRGVDLALLAELFELDRKRRLALLEAVDADRPLVRWNLLTLEGSRETLAIHRSLQVSPDVVATLSGVRHLPPVLVPHASLRQGRADLDGLVLAPEAAARFEPLLRALATERPVATLPWFVLWGPMGSGRRELATRLAGAAQHPTLVFDPTTCGAEELLVRLHQAQREALIRGAALAIAPIEAGTETARAIVRALRLYPELVFLGVTAQEPPRLETDHTIHEVPLGALDRASAQALWQRALADVPDGAALDVTPIIDGFRLTAGDILATIQLACASASAQGRTIELGDLRRGVDLRLRTQLGDVVERVEVTDRWEDLVLPDPDIERLREFIGRKRYASVVYDEWGLADRIRYGKGMIALFSGPPGTGKTMLAGVIAHQLELDLYRVDLSQVVSKWAGETEKQLAGIFDIAERTQAVLLFDEADSLFGKRGEIEGGRDRYANLTVNYLLQRLERYPGVAVLTTNKEAALDEALQRRLSLHLRLELPEVPERKRLWRSFLRDQIPGAATIDVEWLAHRFELAGGSIKNAAVRAAFLAAADGHPLDLPVVIAAVERELDDMGRVVWQLPGARTAPDGAVDISDVILD